MEDVVVILSVLSQDMFWIKFMGISYDIALGWIQNNSLTDKSTQVQVIVGSVRQQAITGANVNPNLCYHMALPSHNGLKYTIQA